MPGVQGQNERLGFYDRAGERENKRMKEFHFQNEMWRGDPLRLTDSRVPWFQGEILKVLLKVDS